MPVRIEPSPGSPVTAIERSPDPSLAAKKSSILCFAMTDLDNPDGQFFILDGVNNPILFLAKPIPFLATQFFATWLAGIITKRLNTIKNSG